MKTYDVVDLTGDSYLNPVGAHYGDGSGIHQRSVGSITSISIHHDAMTRPHDYDSAARYRAEARHHYDTLGPGIQYHYKIDNTGTIFRLRPLTTWLYVVGSAENTSTIAICLDGYLHNDSNNMGQDATREQYEALYQLLNELCTQHPEFPATWSNVRPHADFSSTACCGNRMTGHIYPIQDQVSAQAQLLNQGTYDWPSLQPGQAQPAPAPVQPTPTPVVETPAAPTVVIKYRVFGLNGKQSGAYTVDANAWNKYKAEGGIIKDLNGNDVTDQLRAKFEPAPAQTDPTIDDHATIQELGNRVTAIEALVQKIIAFFGGLL